MELNSCLYDCRVMHHRLSPKEHKLFYSIFMFGIDLDELENLPKKLFLFGKNRFNLFSFWEKDHFPGAAKTTKENLLVYLQTQGVSLAGGKIFLVTHLRTLGYIFNPVSFYFCYNKSGEPACVVAEVENTFREKKVYLIRDRKEAYFQRTTPKLFYVSPFLALDLDFDFNLRFPQELLEAHIDSSKQGKKVLLASITGNKKSLTDANLVFFALKYPLITLQVIFLIHWNAFLLYLKGVPHLKKSDDAALQKDLVRTESYST